MFLFKNKLLNNLNNNYNNIIIYYLLGFERSEREAWKKKQDLNQVVSKLHM